MEHPVFGRQEVEEMPRLPFEPMSEHAMRCHTIIRAQCVERMPGAVRRRLLERCGMPPADAGRNVGNVPRDAHPRIRQLVDYWRSIHPSGGGLPSRQHIDPVDFPGLLPNVRLIEVYRDPLRFRFRLVGTRMCSVRGRDFTGQWLHDLVKDEQTRSFQDLRQTVLDGKPNWYRGPPLGTLVDKAYYMSERVHLPLASDRQNVDMTLSPNLFGDDNDLW